MNLTTGENASALEEASTPNVLSKGLEPHHSTTPHLPNKPLVVIEPSRSWVTLGLRDLWAYRELLYFLTWRDVKIRYKQTVLGAAWALIQPIFTMLIFTLFFGKLAGVPSDGIPYPIFAFAGLLPWTFFSNSVVNSSNSLVGSSNLITKVYFPRLIIPAATVLAGLVDFAIAFIVLMALMVYYGIPAGWSMLMLPVLVVITSLFALAVGLWLSALNVKYRDIRYAVPFLVQLLMFVSPIIYPSSLVPAKWQWLWMLNPLTGLIEGFRAALFHHKGFDATSLITSTFITLIVLVWSAFTFRRMERSFADVV